MLKLSRILIAASLLLLALAVGLSFSPQQVSAAPHWIVTLTPTLPIQPPTDTAIPTQTQIPSPTPTSGIFPPNQQTATPASPEPPEEEEEERSPTRTPQPVVLPDTGELPPLSGGPSLYVIFAAGLAAGLALGLGLRKRLASWYIRILVVFVLLAVVGLSARTGWAPASVDGAGSSQAASQGVLPF